MSEIPVVIIHLGNQDYFQDCVKINAKTNPVYVIGDHTNRYLYNITNVYHVDHTTLNTPELETFRQHFTNYSTNSAPFELICFVRMFYLKRFLETHSFDTVFHVDSDCIVFQNMSHVFSALSKETKIAYSKNASENPNHMVGCVHNAYLNSEFCKTFIDLCMDIYVNRTKLDMIMPKIQWHKENNVGGGICDMTLYYILYAKNMLEVTDINDLIEYDSEVCTFDHNINTADGYAGSTTYAMTSSRVKELVVENKKPYALDLTTGKRVRLLSIHFSGVAKRLLRPFYAKIIANETIT